MKIENISEGKIIGIGEVSVLPGETKDVPEAYAASPVLEVYRRNGLARIIGEPGGAGDAGGKAAEGDADPAKAAEAAEALRQARLASLNGISAEDLGKLAGELGINMAECKDQADVLKKVRAALKK